MVPVRETVRRILYEQERTQTGVVKRMNELNPQISMNVSKFSWIITSRRKGIIMYLEERIKAVEDENKLLKAEIDQLKKYGTVRYVTPKELAELMNCSLQNVHNKIRNGSIQVTRKLGSPRIPMNQFLEADNIIEIPKVRKKREQKEPTMAEQIFG